jgi:hypothetical protein
MDLVLLQEDGLAANRTRDWKDAGRKTAAVERHG